MDPWWIPGGSMFFWEKYLIYRWVLLSHQNLYNNTSYCVFLFKQYILYIVVFFFCDNRLIITYTYLGVSENGEKTHEQKQWGR